MSNARCRKEIYNFRIVIRTLYGRHKLQFFIKINFILNNFCYSSGVFL